MNLLQFIRAERTGHWDMHKRAVHTMLPTFHAAAHLPYAKAAHMYLQEMERLENGLSQEDLHKFTSAGYFTIRRTHKFWSGVWTDMTIEQVVMKRFKSKAG